MGCAMFFWLPCQGVCLRHALTRAEQQASRGKFLCAGEQRAYRVKVRAQDLTGQPLTLTLTDWRARIFQHEFDHLQVPPASRSFTDCDLLEQLMCGLPLKRCMRMVRSKTAACLFV